MKNNFNKCLLSSQLLNFTTFLRLYISTFLRFTFFLFTFHLSHFTVSFAQVNFEPTTSSVYGFLERMSSKGIIQTNEEILPFSRKYIAEKIQNLEFRIKNSEEQQKISNIEQQELEYYIRDYAVELKRLGFDVSKYEIKNKLIDLKSDQFGFDKYNRFRLFSFDNDNFGLFADPLLKYEKNFYDKGNSWSYSNGIKFYGFIGENVSFDFSFTDNHPRGDNLDYTRAFSPLSGFEFHRPGIKEIEFDNMNANLTFGWNWGSFTIGKDFNYYGSGEEGKLILSNKAPSFPHIKLEVNPISWLRFSYIYGSLHSQVLDSNTFRYNPNRNHISTVPKYFAAHMLSINPWQNLNISLGESVVYSDKFEPIYLIPVAFFRLADHYLTDPDENAGNAQLFASLWYKNYSIRTKFYSSIFIDELSTYNSEYPQAVGFNLGLKTIDPLIPESELTLEYTRINPFVYFHADSAQTYANYGYEMGHWIGSNADEIFLSFRKRILRGLDLGLSYRFIRKGDEEDFNEPRYQESQTFLWGERDEITMYEIWLNYEIMHGFNFNVSYQNQDETVKNKYLVYTGSRISVALSYGL